MRKTAPKPPAHPALPPIQHPDNVLPLRSTFTITGPGGKESKPVDIDKLEKLADEMEKVADEMEKVLGQKRPGKRPQIHVDPAEVAKLEKALGKEATETLRACDHDELRQRIVALSEHEIETEQAKAGDKEMKDLQAKLNEMAASYKETLKFLKMRRRLCVLLMQERGKPVGK